MKLELRCNLTPVELEAAGQQLADVVEKTESVQAEKSAASAGFRAQLERLEAQALRLANMIKLGTETREVECEERPKGGVIVTVRLDTGETIGARPMTPDERQVTFFSIEGGRQDVEREPAAD